MESKAENSTAVMSPCAACRILRRRCDDKCALAPYFPPSQPYKFAIAHRVFGASNIIRLLQELPEGKREDAANSIIYEATARVRDPVYGCTGAIFQLQRDIAHLQAQLAKAQAELYTARLQRTNLLAQYPCMEVGRKQQPIPIQQEGEQPNQYLSDMDDDFVWGPLWT